MQVVLRQGRLQYVDQYEEHSQEGEEEEQLEGRRWREDHSILPLMDHPLHREEHNRTMEREHLEREELSVS